MAFGLAIYGTESVSSVRAFEEAARFFGDIKIEANAHGYYKYRENRDNEDLDFIDTTFNELENALASQNAKDFRIYHVDCKDDAWDAGFGFSTKNFGGFFHINIQFNGESPEPLLVYLKGFFRRNTASYAISYKCCDVYDAYHYAIGENMVKIFPWENAMAFNKEVDGRFKGKARFNSTLLRLVYPVNVLNSSHMDINIGELTLSETIHRNEWGKLTKIEGTDERWLWMVQEELLEGINNELGKAGILTAWKKPALRRKNKLLP
ncbi:hypothetical protein SNN58_004288 [Cronobacter dublinensis]|nr:hypothetical protein [Cronobacter dublinensis]ELY3972802.1 hypothetical protein [Cronobacter dublinensis]ELY4487404.1 hypothetical protein [Cronobacter dublinensis]ELY5825675.1 hypothetical protein [Cronobacter dublinensis]